MKINAPAGLKVVGDAMLAGALAVTKALTSGSVSTGNISATSGSIGKMSFGSVSSTPPIIPPVQSEDVEIDGKRVLTIDDLYVPTVPDSILLDYDGVTDDLEFVSEDIGGDIRLTTFTYNLDRSLSETVETFQGVTRTTVYLYDLSGKLTDAVTTEL